MTSEKLAALRAELLAASQADTLPEKKDDVADIKYGNGDLFDEDSGEHLGSVDVRDAHEDKPTDTIPASMSMYMNGYFYVFTIQRRYKEGEDNGDQATRVQA